MGREVGKGQITEPCYLRQWQSIEGFKKEIVIRSDLHNKNLSGLRGERGFLPWPLAWLMGLSLRREKIGAGGGDFVQNTHFEHAEFEVTWRCSVRARDVILKPWGEICVRELTAHT